MTNFLNRLVQLPPMLLALIFGAQGILWLIKPMSAAKFWAYEVPDGGLATCTPEAATLHTSVP